MERLALTVALSAMVSTTQANTSVHPHVTETDHAFKGHVQTSAVARPLNDDRAQGDVNLYTEQAGTQAIHSWISPAGGVC